MTDQSTARSTPTRRSAMRPVVAASIGNALEWFDIAIFGFLGATLAAVFYPSDDPTVGLLLTFGTFAVSFVVRPLGAIVLGSYADRHGRKATLMLSIRLMMLGTAIIVVLPGYATLGALAPVLLLVARLVQGFSAGGEFGSATAFLVEQDNPRKGFLGSWQFASQGLATLLAAGFGTALTTLFTPEQLTGWAWRIPFAFGLLIGPVGWYVRRHLPEPPESAVANRQTEASPLREIVRGQKTRLLVAGGALVVSTVVNYVILYVPTFASKELGLPASSGFVATLVTGAILLVATPWFGHLADRFGAIRVMTVAGVLIATTTLPLFFVLTAAPALPLLIAVMAWIGLLKAAYYGPLPSLMAACFPSATRASGLSLSYNAAVVLFGGVTPLISTALIAGTGSNAVPGVVVAVAAVLSLAALATGRKGSIIR
ncbi:MFS transporter [Pseudonocardia sp. C8]|uniref:MFS transporter n=1 Tax=Pseudonocardia sp. C8 TaxID=2762759 RepID=UPI0016435A08|nr:MFS transporter [Pseudonocardia sp. C8]MBC3191156.1 MFS transporter [Pseudonocardia sp. C8]